MHEIWMAEEHHGYKYFFSTEEKANGWYEKEIAEVDRDDPYVESWEELDEPGQCRYLYMDGDLVARITKFRVDWKK